MQLDKYELLEKAKIHFKENLTEFTYSMAIEPMSIEVYDDENIVLVLPNPSQKNLLINNTLPIVEETFQLLTNRKHNITILHEAEVEEFKQNYQEKNMQEIARPSNIIPNFNFDTFVVGTNNDIATAAAKSVAQNPSNIYNPLFIYGDPGLGKTHLMHAIANEILRTRPKTKIIYVSSEKFLNDLVNSIRNRDTDTEEFRQKYRNIDVLLMDDVQFLSGKDTAQLELFNTFNHLHENGKQIILSADKPPKDIPVLEARLKSRFNQGIIADIGQPNFETRLAILKQKAEEKNIIIDDSILSLIAEKINTNIRDLEGVLNKVVVISTFTKLPITVESTEKAINEISLENENIITPNSIIEVICNYFNVSSKDILSSKKSKEFVFPRQIAMYLCRSELDLPYKKIGDIFGKKDHTTIMHAETKIANSIKTDKQTKLIVESVENILRKMNQ